MHVYHMETQNQQPASSSCTTFVPLFYFSITGVEQSLLEVQRLPVPRGPCCCKDACQQTAASQCTLPSPGFSAVLWWPSPLEAQAPGIPLHAWALHVSLCQQWHVQKGPATIFVPGTCTGTPGFKHHVLKLHNSWWNLDRHSAVVFIPAYIQSTIYLSAYIKWWRMRS